MPRFRERKAELTQMCAAPDWARLLANHIAGAPDFKGVINALLALLPRPYTRWQAAYGLGAAVALLARSHLEDARIIMRRLMWSLNEDSGNLGWGVPEAMGCILGASPALAKEYARIFISYGYETGKSDNFLEHAPLRQGVFWGIGRLASTNAAEALPALPHLIQALEDEYRGIRAMAAFALEQLALSRSRQYADKAGTPNTQNGPDSPWPAAAKALEKVLSGLRSKKSGAEAIELLQGEAIVARSLDDIYVSALTAARDCAGH